MGNQKLQTILKHGKQYVAGYHAWPLAACCWSKTVRLAAGITVLQGSIQIQFLKYQFAEWLSFWICLAQTDRASIIAGGSAVFWYGVVYVQGS